MKSTRLILLVLLLGVAICFQLSAKPRPASGPEWQATEKTDSRGATYTQFTLPGRFVKRPHAEVSAPPSLAVNCEGTKGSRFSRVGFQGAALRVGANLKIDYVEPDEIRGMSYFPQVEAQYRLDDGKEERENWNPGQDKTSAFVPKDAIKKMLRARTVLITVKEDSAGEVEMQFDMPDATNLGQVCRLPVRKK